MSFWNLVLLVFIVIVSISVFIWVKKDRKFESIDSVSSAYDNWTNDQLLEKLWGEHIHLGYYLDSNGRNDFRSSKIEFVHQLVKWSGIDKLPSGSRILDVGCGIGGSSRILAREYGFEVVGITISPAQVKRANQLTQDSLTCSFRVMDALNLKFSKGSFDGVWSVEAGPHMLDKQLYADEMLRVLRPGGVLAVADWNERDFSVTPINNLERIVMKMLLNQWAHPSFSSIKGFELNLLNSRYIGGSVVSEDWTSYTISSWMDSIYEGFRRPKDVLSLGHRSLLIGLREVPTILLMNWAFSNGLMKFGVFRARG